jgi:aspartate racemase
MSLKIGLIGGLGWPATVAYYEAICRAARDCAETGSPEMTVESLDMAKTLAARGTRDNDASWSAFDGIFQHALARLHNAGCEIAAIASVTPHNRFAAISKESRIRLVNIVDAVASNLPQGIAKEAVVLGTSVTMQGTLFDDALMRSGINIRRVKSSDIAVHSDLLETYFYSGRAEEGREALIRYVRSISGDSEEILCVLACTDLAPAFPDKAGQVIFDAGGIKFCDATAAHVQAILAATRENSDQVHTGRLRDAEVR